MNLKKQEKITSREVSSSISQVAEKLGINAEQLKEGIANSFRESYCQGDNAEADLEFDFSGELTVFRKYRLVLEVKDVAKEIILDDSLLSQGKIVGEFFYLSLPVEGFSSNLIQDIGRRIRAGIREVRRQKQLENFRKQKDQLIKGRVSRVDSRLKVGIVDLEDGNIGY